MFDAVVTALFRAVSVDVTTDENGKKALVAPEPLDSPPKGALEADDLRPIGRQKALPAPSMWN